MGALSSNEVTFLNVNLKFFQQFFSTKFHKIKNEANHKCYSKNAQLFFSLNWCNYTSWGISCTQKLSHNHCRFLKKKFCQAVLTSLYNRIISQVEKGNRVYIAHISLRVLTKAIHINKPEKYGLEEMSVNQVFNW